MVLDKSFLDAAGSAQLQYYASKGWTFGVPEALLYELMRKRDRRRTSDLWKLCRIHGSLVKLPGIGAMFRAEVQLQKPAISTLRAQRAKMPSTESQLEDPFGMSSREQRDTEDRTAALLRQLPSIVEVWRSLGSLLELGDVNQNAMVKSLEPLQRQVRDDREAVRQLYENHRSNNFPSSKLIDEQWALFRWFQVYLIAGLDFLGSHGLKGAPNQEKLLHERIDLDYTIPALLVGGLACCEKRILRRFKLLRPDGVVLSL